MDDKSFIIRVPKKWVRTAIVVVATTLIVAPLTAWASHSFTDVPDTNTFHADIEWLKNSGVTKGCNPPANTLFCPKDEVTREQMSAFMRRLAEYLDAEDGTPAQADNADTVDGKHASAFLGANAKAADSDKLDGKDLAELAPRAAFDATTDAPNGVDFTLSTEITAPARGILLMSGGVDASNSLSEDFYVCSLAIDNGVVTGSVMASQLDGASAENVNVSEDCTTSGAAVVDPGTHTIDFQVLLVAADTNLNDASVSVLWVPYDGTGAVPAAVTPLGEPADISEDRVRE